MKTKKILWCLLAALAIVSCKEDDGTVEEYPDWQGKNDRYFQQLVSETQTAISAGDASWQLITGYSKPVTNYSPQYYDYIVVKKLETGKETTSPLHTDSVEVHYTARLLPSTSYPEGLEFNHTYNDPFDPVEATPVKFSVGGTVVGFSTALQHMHRGDHWRVYIPYQLGYASATSLIPQYSTLIFDLRLEDFWYKVQGDRE